MQETKLDSAWGFFEQVLRPSYEEFIRTPSSFRTAFNAAAALFHIHEWVFKFKKLEIEAKYGISMSTHGDFWETVEKEVPEAGFVRDLANASKHLSLSRAPSTPMTDISNTSLRSVSFGEGPFGSGRYSGPNVTMSDGSRDVRFDECARELYSYWSALLAELYP